MKREEKKEEHKELKTWKKPELKVLDKGETAGGVTYQYTEDMAYGDGASQ